MYDPNVRYRPHATGIKASIESIHRDTLLFYTRRIHHLKRRMEDTDDMDEVILNNFYFNKLFDNDSVIKIVWECWFTDFVLHTIYMFRNYARMPRPTFPLIIVLIYIVNLGIHNVVYLKERPCMEIQRITHLCWWAMHII